MISPSKLEQSVSPKKTLTTSNMEPPEALALDALVFTLVPTPTSTNELFQQFIKAYLGVQTFILV